jgi:hypothetical protein
MYGFISLSFHLPRSPQVPLIARPGKLGLQVDLGEIEPLIFLLRRHTPALGSSGGRHRFPEGSKGQSVRILSK